MKKIYPFIFILLLVACGENDEAINSSTSNPDVEQQSNRVGAHQKTPLDNKTSTGTEKLTEIIKQEPNPKFPVGSKVMILANHINGMKGAEGKIVGAYDTTAYEVKYLPTTGGKKVIYKWLVDQELEGASGAPLEKGLNVVIRANHIDGMEGASGEIVQSNESTVYIVDFTTTNGEEVTDYKWLTEDELSTVE